jgi:ribose transport system permease protein
MNVSNDDALQQTTGSDRSAPATGKKRRDRAKPLKRTALSALEKYALLGAWALLVIGFSIANPNTFATAGNAQTIFGSQAVLLCLALGLIIPLTTGDFDLSIASTLTLSSMMVALLTQQDGWALAPAIVCALLAALAVGVINACLIVLVGLDSFIVTLGMATFLGGVVTWVSNSQTVTGIPPFLSKWTVGNEILGIPLTFWYCVVGTLVLWVVLQRTPLGRRLLFVGRGRSVARMTGLPVVRLRFGALLCSAGIAGLAGIFYYGTLASADPTSGQSFLLPAFAAAYLGATAIVPGRFNAIGTFVAVYFLVSGITGLQLLGAQSYIQQVFYGAALIIAVTLSHLARPKAGRA